MNLLPLLISCLQILPSLTNPNEDMCPREIPIHLTKKQREQLQQDFMAMLGVSKRPSFNPEIINRSSSKFLLDVYKFLKQEVTSKRVKRAALYFGEEILNKVQTSDLIVSLNILKLTSKGKYHKLAFPLKNFPESESLIDAELRLYQEESTQYYGSRSMYKISLYTPIETKSGPIKLKKVGEKLTTAVSPYASSQKDEGSHFTSLETLGLILQSSTSQNLPYIISFLKNDNKLFQINLRPPRDTSGFEMFEFMEDLEADTGCSMYPYKISFRELMWDDFIIAPAGYTSAFCRGRCSFPLKRPISATNHALVQSLVFLKNEEDVPEPVCAAKQLDPLNILYKDEEYTILKKYRDMVVTECACQ
ncbi:bone morphogenetic protein 7-like isoform X2 [Sitophilus oryzae]|uniref:Bone morphogenetic protein 7-like isoform X2 n=1 Tax=Sitophilus oryzae TaxID=7048 RepID=A0A6J2Y093_SITOR|nr:bone morphogenetic protein 7-like isoform X2 [Sitophilus oryzae]